MRVLLSCSILLLPLLLHAQASPHVQHDWKDDWATSRTMDAPVLTESGEKVGAANDVLSMPADAIVAIIVRTSNENGIDHVYSKVDGSHLAFNPEATNVGSRIDQRPFEQRVAKESPGYDVPERIEASDPLGKNVNLRDAQNHGEIVGFLISPRAKEITAFAVESHGAGRRIAVITVDSDGVERVLGGVRNDMRVEALDHLYWQELASWQGGRL